MIKIKVMCKVKQIIYKINKIVRINKIVKKVKM